MKYQIESADDELNVQVTDIESKREELLGAFQECQEGKCSCPTDEYGKLDSLEVEEGEGAVHLKLKSKAGMRLDEKEIDKCLAYTRDRVAHD